MTSLLLMLACGGWRANVKEGDRWLEADNPAAASRSYNKALKRRPDDPEIALKMARAELGAGRPFDALPWAEAAHEAQVEGALPVYIDALVHTWRIEPALELLGEDPSVELLPLAAEAWIGAGELEKAAATLAEAEPTPQNQATHAYLEARLGRPEAIEALDAVAQDWIGVPSGAWADAGAAWLALGNLDAAFALGRSAVANNPGLMTNGGEAEMWAESAVRADELDRGEAALRYGFRAATVSPDDAQLAWELGSRLVAADQPLLGTAWLEHALVTPPYDDPDATSGVVAVSASSLGRDERNAVRRDIARPLANAYLAMNQPQDEVRAVRVMVASQSPPDPNDLMRLSHAYARANDHLSSAAAAQNAYSMGHPQAAEQAARAYAALGNLATAIGWASTALEDDPGNADLCLLLAQLYTADRRYQAALEVLDQGIEANPDDLRLQGAQKRVFNAAL
jgi:tetratricopeptide (TPR) repeat protein